VQTWGSLNRSTIGMGGEGQWGGVHVGKKGHDYKRVKGGHWKKKDKVHGDGEQGGKF
jgi:hypothetical protein